MEATHDATIELSRALDLATMLLKMTAKVESKSLTTPAMRLSVAWPDRRADHANLDLPLFCRRLQAASKISKAPSTRG